MVTRVSLVFTLWLITAHDRSRLGLIASAKDNNNFRSQWVSASLIAEKSSLAGAPSCGIRPAGHAQKVVQLLAEVLGLMIWE